MIIGRVEYRNAGDDSFPNYPLNAGVVLLIHKRTGLMRGRAVVNILEEILRHLKEGLEKTYDIYYHIPEEGINPNHIYQQTITYDPNRMENPREREAAANYAKHSMPRKVIKPRKKQ